MKNNYNLIYFLYNQRECDENKITMESKAINKNCIFYLFQNLVNNCVSVLQFDPLKFTSSMI